MDIRISKLFRKKLEYIKKNLSKLQEDPGGEIRQ